jgi:YVTN family beta-propeller protein
VIWIACAFGVLTPGAYANRAYVSNEDGHSVTVIDAASAEVIATIPVGKRPRGLKLNHDGSRLFVAVSGLPKCPPTVPDEECAKQKRDLAADGIAVVDTAAQKVTQVLKAGSDPEQFDLSADGQRLFVANEDIAMTTVLDIRTGKVIARIPVGREPEGVVTAPNGRWVFVTNESDNSVSVIDTGTLKVLRSVQVGKRPRDLAFTPDGRFAYVSGELDASVYRISVPDGKSVERVVQLRKEALPMSVVLDAPRDRLYVSTGRGRTVAVIDLAKEAKLVTEIQVGTRPWGIALSEDGRWLYTANGPSNDVTVVDVKDLKVVKRIPSGKSPWGVVLGPAPPSKDLSTRPTASHLQPARPKGVGLGVAVELDQGFGAFGVPEDASALAWLRCVSHERGSFDEIVVAQALGNPVDCTATLIQIREFSALHDTLVHILDSRVGRVVVGGEIAARRLGRRERAEQQNEESQGYARVA